MKLLSDKDIAALPRNNRPAQTLESVALTEPRLPMIERRLRQLLQVVQLESGGVPIEPDGFRLRNPSDWTAPTAPVSSELWHISTACNMRCPFCYEEGDPQEGSTINDAAEMVTLEEIETRLKYRDKFRGTGLFRPLTNINEIFCNPDAMDIMERLRREAPDEVFTFVTNGTYLTEEVVARLAKLKPLYFNYSVNSLDPLVRERILRDRTPAIAIEAIELLRRYEIPYLGSLVCWPTIPWSDIEHTVRELDRAGCAVIRFSLSAYSKHLKGRRFDRLEFWNKGVELAQRLAAELDTPVKIEPYHFADPSNQANIVGSIVGSPAHRANVRPGDRIVAANGKPVKSANHALTAIAKAAHERRDLTLKIVNRSGLLREVVLHEDSGEDRYPYRTLSDFPGFQFGLVLVENLKYGHIQQIAEIVKRYDAKRPLLLSSELMRPIVEEMIAQTRPLGDRELAIEVPKNRFFGGTVVLGDLLVVDDYVAFINEYCARQQEPIDLVIIPATPFSLSGWMRDLAGKPANEIERRTGVRIAFLECQPLTG